jgi:hypothetical protein
MIFYSVFDGSRKNQSGIKRAEMAIETITRGVIGRSRLTDKAKIIIDGIRAKYITREKKILLVSKKAENEDVS